jgi:hypothetical protein
VIDAICKNPGCWKITHKEWLWDFMTQENLHELLNNFKRLNHDIEPPENHRIIVTTVPVEKAE